MDSDLPKLLNLHEVHARTGISLRVLQDGCQPRNGRFEHVRIGRTPQMTEDQVLRLIEANVQTPREDDELAAVRTRVARKAARTQRNRVEGAA